MGFFLTTPFNLKPADFLRPDLGHPSLKGVFSRWPFFRNGIFQDVVGNNHLSILAGDPTRVITSKGSAVDFDGNDSLEVTGYNPSYPITLTAYIKANTTSGARSILYFGVNNNESGLAIVDGNFWAVTQSGGGYGAATDSSTNTTDWFHVVGVFAAVNNRKLYINGDLKDTNIYGGTALVSSSARVGNRYTANQYFDGQIADASIYYEALSDAQVKALYDNLWAPFESRIWVPTGPPGIVNLNINDLSHTRLVDEVDVVEIITIIPIDIDTLRHARRVDTLQLGVLFDLFLASLRHARPVDAIALDVSVDLTIETLRHGRAVDIVDLQELVGVVLNVTDQRHIRPVDSLLLAVDQLIIIDGLRHRRPIDAIGVQPLLGDQTGIGATVSAWILDAGQPLNNASSVDFDYHVLEGIFDSDQSVLGVDGSRVTGSAGMRELTALTLGANVDGQERVQGEIAEIRIYAGALSQADRDRILQELTTKWITG